MKRKLSGDEIEEDSTRVEETVRRRINFDEEGNQDSDDEIVFDRQAHKRRKMSADIEALKVWIDKKFKESNDATAIQTNLILNSVTANAERSRRNTDDIVTLQKSVANIENMIGAEKGGAGPSAPPGQATSSLSQPVCPPTKSTHDRNAFQLSRRRLRLWPIAGENDDELMEAVEVFCCQALGAPRKDQLGISKVTRVKSAPRGVAYMEALVEFADSYNRDDILMRGPMLAMYRENDKPTAGIRLDIPQHLMGSFKTLEAFGFGLKRRHGKGFRKHIKFDDFTEELYIQVGMRKDEEDETEWQSYTAREAREGLKRLNAKKGPRFDFLSTPPGQQNEERTAGTQRRGEKEKEKSTGTGYGWVPPARGQGSGWRPPARGAETEEDDNME